MTPATLISLAFGLSFLVSVIVTPRIGQVGIRLGAVDRPDGRRKLHSKPMPRIGGLAILGAFSIALTLELVLDFKRFEGLIVSGKLFSFYLGALICFGMGMADDFRPINSKIKLFFQILGASVAYWGGIRIESILSYSLDSPFWSYFVTISWFLLFVNAVNLIDGLDGLAGGITFFVSLIAGIFSFWDGQYVLSILFFALSGAILGFLRYNFNPASIFMGDGGAYVIGFLIAALSILGKYKGRAGAALLILLVAMGIPVFDTIVSTVRRFMLGKKIFEADKSHIHHRLVAHGFSTKRAVVILYGISIGLTFLAFILVNLRDGIIGIFLILLGVGSIVSVKKLGYFEYIALDKLYGWFKDMTDQAGLSRERRTFLSLQVEIRASRNFDELWDNVCAALEKLRFSRGEFYPITREEVEGNRHDNGHNGNGSEKPRSDQSQKNAPNKNLIGRQSSKTRVWLRSTFEENSGSDRLLKIDLPLVNGGDINFGYLRLVKDLKEEPIDQFTFSRVESLRRTVVTAVQRILLSEANRISESGKKR